ncbi:MAG: helix-turn-helix domain-containing protein [Chitinivibrionales bacterium]|nr:helix-turn-helix domain-containing protein [Chitinivibrionales bacterium]MBD3356160.1 helix-turn-helix domain-containing protein [Chitinivibrionales bacterium]
MLVWRARGAVWEGSERLRTDCRLLFSDRFVFHQGLQCCSHTHHFWQLEIVENGMVYAEIGCESRTLLGGSMVLIPHEFVHRFVYRENATRSMSLKFAMDHQSIFSKPYWIGPSSLNTSLVAILARLVPRGRSERLRDRPLVNYTMSALVNTVINSHEKAVVSPSRIATAQKVYDAVVEWDTWPIRIEQISSRLGISVSRISHAFSEYYGEALKSFIDRTRCELVTHHLQFSDMSIKAIAIAMGFDDVHGLSRFCKRVAGLSPRPLRRKLRGELS